LAEDLMDEGDICFSNYLIVEANVEIISWVVRSSSNRAFLR